MLHFFGRRNEARYCRYGLSYFDFFSKPMRDLFVNDHESRDLTRPKSKEKLLSLSEVLISGRQRSVENHFDPLNMKRAYQQKPYRDQNFVWDFQVKMRSIQHPRRISIAKNQWDDAESSMMKERRVDLLIGLVWIGPDPYSAISQPLANSVDIN